MHRNFFLHLKLKSLKLINCINIYHNFKILQYFNKFMKKNLRKLKQVIQSAIERT